MAQRDVFDWFLPVHNIALIIIGIVAFAIAAVIFGALAVNLSRWWWLAVLVLAPLVLFNFAWVVYAATRPKEIDETIDYSVKVVTYPNGDQVQMFTVDGDHKNANQMFGCQVPEGRVIRRHIYKKVYAGVKYDVNGNPSIRDTFHIADPKKDE